MNVKPFTPWIKLDGTTLEYRRTDGFSVKSFQNVACTILKANRELLLDKSMKTHVISALFLLTSQCHCDGLAQSIAHLFKPELFQGLQTKGLKRKEENWLVQTLDLDSNQPLTDTATNHKQAHSVSETTTKRMPSGWDCWAQICCKTLRCWCNWQVGRTGQCKENQK